MGSISLDNDDQVETNPSQDWLDMEQQAQACVTEFSMDLDQPNGQNDETQDNSDLLPFDPDY